MKRFMFASGLALSLWLGVLSAQAVNDPGGAPPPPLPGGVTAAKAPDKKPTADQQRAEAQARFDGIHLEWNEQLGSPRVLRGRDLGARRAFSGGKGLAAKGRSHAEDAVAVLDNLSRFYGFRDAAKEFRADRADADKLGFHHAVTGSAR